MEPKEPVWKNINKVRAQAGVLNLWEKWIYKNNKTVMWASPQACFIIRWSYEYRNYHGREKILPAKWKFPWWLHKFPLWRNNSRMEISIVIFNFHCEGKITLWLYFFQNGKFHSHYGISIGKERLFVNRFSSTMEISILVSSFILNQGLISWDLWAHNQHLVKIIFPIIMILIIQSSHKSAYVTTAKLSWHMQIYNLNGSSYSKLKQH